MAASATSARYDAHAGRIVAASPTYAAWARSVASAADVVAVLDTLPPTQRQPELLFAVARRLGAAPSDPAALVDLVRTRTNELATALRSATMQTNDPRRLAAVLPLFAEVDGPVGLVDVGASAGLCSIPDRVTLDYVVAQEHGPQTARRMTTARAAPAIHLRAAASGAVPSPFVVPDVVARVALDPAPIDLDEPGAFDRLVEGVPPEATDRIALMREAALVTRTVPPVRIRGRAPDDLDAALAALPDGCTPVVLTTGTLVYLPGAARQATVDRLAALAARGVRWIAMERTGALHDVARTLPHGVDAADPGAFATVSLDGTARAVSDPFGTAVRWF